ncbi:MAG: HEPN domain-containing protein [Deltaproteobacteria bacterium]|nr:HEPN domain-containing protein [Deltaproteobacteria bacterium]
MTKQGKFEKIHADELMLIAEQDLESARALASVQAGRPENIFLLAQQGLAKALKAILCWREQPIPFVHDSGSR